MVYNKTDWASHDVITTGKMNNIEDGIQTALNNSIFGHGGAEQPSEGTHVTNYIDLGDNFPKNALSGDVTYVRDGDDYKIYQYDGVSWVEQINPKFSQRLEETMLEAKAQTETLISENQVNVDKTINEVKEEQDNLQKGLNNLNTNAQDYANKALTDARADIATTAQDLTKKVQQETDDRVKAVSDATAHADNIVATAKSDLVNTISKETSDRNAAVADLDTKAQSYATTAKNDAISASTTADGVINKKIDDTASSIASTISQNKKDADGKITTAQSTATQALNGLATKVSQTAYDAKTGQLQTDINTTTTTANQAKTDIVAIKKTNTDQDTRMTTIESDANGIKTTVSSLQTTANNQAGSISTLQQRADGFDATVATLGQINQLFNTEFIPDFAGWYTGISPSSGMYKTGNPLGSDTSWSIGSGKYNGSTVLKHVYGSGNLSFFSDLIPVGEGVNLTGSIVAMSTPEFTGSVSVAIYLRYYDSNKNYVGVKSADSGKLSTWTQKYITQVTPTGTAYVSFNIQTNGGAGVTYYSQPMLAFNNKVGKYVQGNYNNNASVAKAQLTADNATVSINNYKTDADGRISKAQADIIVNANAITQKVSQTEYNAKTGDLTTKVNTAQSTADSASTAITNYKTSNDGRVSAAEGAIKTNADAITQKVSKIDYDQKTGELSGKISEVNQTADKISQSVSDVKTQVDGLSVGGRNLVTGTEKDTAWSADIASKYSFRVIKTGLKPGQTYTFSAEVTLGNTDQKITTVSLFNEPIGQYLTSNDNFKADGTRDHWTFTVPTTVNTPTASLIIYAGTPGSTGGKSVTYHHIKVETGNLPTDWTPAPEDTDNKISTVSQTVDSISSIVSDPTIGLTKRIQTAEGTLSQVTGADIPNLQKATYWQAPNGYDLNTYLTQGSFFFANTNARTNNPKADNGWMYLVVEQANGGSRVTQTAWYDSVASARYTYRRQYTSGTWSPWYANDNDSVTSISQTNGAIQQEVKDRTNGDSNTLTQAKNFTTSSITSSETGMKSLITQTSDSIVAQIGNTNLITNSEFDPDNAGWYDVPAAGTIIGSPVKTPISKYFKDVVNNSKGLAFGNGSGTWYTSEPVPIAPGTKISMSMFAGRAFASTTATTMDFRIGRWDVNKKFITSSFGPNPINGTTPVPIKTYKVENITVPADTYYISMVFSHSGNGAGMEDSIYHPMINVGEKAFAYSPTYGTTSSATQLALMKDNWSIGINDNAGKLASGVFGTIDGMNLVGNKMTINANQTTITGTTWIQTGMIGQGIIGSAQISQLDVNKLVGNTSNFVKSAWDSAYGSTVTIDGSGMAIRAGGSNGFYTRLQSGKLQFESLYSDATLPGGVRHEIIGSVFGGSDAQVGGDVDALSFTLFDQTFPSFTDGYPVGSPKDGSGYIWGGDKITWNVADTQAGHVRELFGWYNTTASSVQGISRGFNFFDRVNFNGSEIEISGAQNNLIFTWAQWNGYFSNEKSPAIVAANKGWRGGGIAFGNNSVVVYNAANGINKILM